MITAALGLVLDLTRSGHGRAAHEPSVPGTVSAAAARMELPAVLMTYEPGQTSSWHIHPGLHEVTVVEGTLTVYGSDCRARTYGAGEMYVGGLEPHLARNEGADRLEMALRWILREERVPPALVRAVHEPKQCQPASAP